MKSPASAKSTFTTEAKIISIHYQYQPSHINFDFLKFIYILNIYFFFLKLFRHLKPNESQFLHCIAAILLKRLDIAIFFIAVRQVL